MKKEKLFLIIILSIAIIFRFIGINWDQGHHLHPDERFLTMVMNDSKMPTSFKQYLDPQSSTLNPYNLNYNFFVYGNFPLILNKGIAVVLKNNNYQDLTLQGRFLAGFFDLITVILIFLIAKIWEKKYNWSNRIKYFASFIYTCFVLAIQQSHFFTVDIFLSTFCLASYYFISRFEFSHKYPDLILSAIFISLALASKITAIFFIPLVFLVLIIKLIRTKKSQLLFLIIPIYLLVSYLGLRLANPYLFESVSWFNPTINKQFIANLKELKSWEGNDVWFPPAVQWIDKPAITFALKNLVLYGMGLISSILALKGLFNLIKLSIDKIKTKKYFWQGLSLLLTYLYLIIFFIYQSSRFTKTLRYFIIILPFLAISAAYCLDKFYIFSKKKKLFLIISSLAIILWPLMFISIYLQPHSRVQASYWIENNLENGAVIATELWDDALPLHLDNSQKQFKTIQLPVFNMDSKEKWQTIYSQLDQADYYILSSNRAWGSISQAANKYPQASKFYQYLLDNKLNFKKLIEFNSYPSLQYLGLAISITDDAAEEAFTVYDHPKVIIYKKIDL